MADGLCFARITRGNGGFVFLTGSTGNAVARNDCLVSPSSPYTARGIVLYPWVASGVNIVAFCKRARLMPGGGEHSRCVFLKLVGIQRWRPGNCSRRQAVKDRGRGVPQTSANQRRRCQLLYERGRLLQMNQIPLWPRADAWIHKYWPLVRTTLDALCWRVPTQNHHAICLKMPAVYATLD